MCILRKNTSKKEQRGREGEERGGKEEPLVGRNSSLCVPGSQIPRIRDGRSSCTLVGKSGSPVLGAYLVNLGLTGKGRKGRNPTLLAYSLLISTL